MGHTKNVFFMEIVSEVFRSCVVFVVTVLSSGVAVECKGPEPAAHYDTVECEADTGDLGGGREVLVLSAISRIQ